MRIIKNCSIYDVQHVPKHAQLSLHFVHDTNENYKYAWI